MEPDSTSRRATNCGIWWRVARPHTLTAAVMPVLIGTSAAWTVGKPDWTLFAAMAAASILIQSAVNMFNEYYDYKRGLDSRDSVGIGGVIVNREVHESAVLRMAAVLVIVSIFLGAFICQETSWWLALVGTASIVVGYLYSAGRNPIAYTRFGEAAAGLFMGPVIVLISFYIQRGTITLPSILISVPISILVAAILLANNIRDEERDRQKGRTTLAVLWRHDKAVKSLDRFFMSAYIWTIGLVILKIATPWTLLVFASVPKARKSLGLFQAGRNPGEMMPAMKATSELHTQFGILMSLGLILGRFLPIG